MEHKLILVKSPVTADLVDSLDQPILLVQSKLYMAGSR